MNIINLIALVLSLIALIFASYVITVLTESLEDCREVINHPIGDETGTGSVEWLDVGDMIEHPEYGTYQKEVPFYQGMTLLPGQSATIKVYRGSAVDWDTVGTKTKIELK